MIAAEALQNPVLRQHWKVIASIVAAVITLIALAHLGIAWLGGSAIRAGLTSDPTPVTVRIGGETLTVPGNMIRFSDQRSGGNLARLDLAIHWPSLSGYTDKNAVDFDDVSPNAPLLFVTVRPRRSEVDSTTRLISLYSRFFDGSGTRGPAGLVSRNLQPGTGYDSEEIYFQPGSTNPFATRCAKSSGGIIPLTCLRDIHVGKELSISYRFRKPLIIEWRRLDPAIRMVIDKMRTKPRG